MAFYDKFPYTNFQELNLDRIIEKIGDIDRAVEESTAQAEASADSAATAAEQAAAASASASTANNAASSIQGRLYQITANQENIEQNRSDIATLGTRVDQILVSGTPTEGNAELIDIRTAANGTVYPLAGDAVRGQVTNLQNQINAVNTSRENDLYTFFAKNAAVPTASGNVNTGIIFDPTQPTYAKITNIDSAAGYFRINYMVDNQTVEYGSTVLLNPGQSVTWTVSSLQSYPNIEQGWYASDNYNLKTTTIGVTNTNTKQAVIDVWNKKDEYPLHENNEVWVTANQKPGYFTDLLGALFFIKNKIDVDNKPCTIRIESGTYTLTSISSRAPVLNKGANKINIIGEDPYNTIIQLTNNNGANNQIMDIGGACVIENLTLKNLRAGNSYSLNNNPYALHNDRDPADTSARYTTLVKNCILYSEMFTPLGAGLRKNQKQIYENVTFIYKGPEALHAPIYIHSPGISGDMPIGLEIKNCIAISQNGTRCMVLPDVYAGDYLNIPVLLKNLTGWTNGSIGTWVSTENTKLLPGADYTFEVNKTADYPIQ